MAATPNAEGVLRWSEMQTHTNPMNQMVKRGSRVGKSMNIGDVDIEPSTKLHAGLDDKKMAELGTLASLINWFHGTR